MKQEEKEGVVFIYRLINDKGQVFYVGKTINPRLRKLGHRSRFKFVFELEIIDEVIPHEVDFWEEHYINLYFSWGYALENKIRFLNDGGFNSFSKRCGIGHRSPNINCIDSIKIVEMDLLESISHYDFNKIKRIIKEQVKEECKKELRKEIKTEVLDSMFFNFNNETAKQILANGIQLYFKNDIKRRLKLNV